MWHYHNFLWFYFLIILFFWIYELHDAVLILSKWIPEQKLVFLKPKTSETKRFRKIYQEQKFHRILINLQWFLSVENLTSSQ